MSVSEKHQRLYKVLNVRTVFYSIYSRDFYPTNHIASQYISDFQPKVWIHAPSLSPLERCSDIGLQVCEQIFAATHDSVHVAIFHLWFLYELLNNYYALRCDSRTCIAVIMEIGHFCPVLNVSHPIINVLQMLTFWAFVSRQ